MSIIFNTLTTATHSTVITSIIFMTMQRKLTHGNNNRRIIRVTGTSNCLHQLSIHIKKMNNSSRCSVHSLWVHQTMMMSNSGFKQFIIKSIQMTSLVLSFKHRSRPHDRVRLQQMFKRLELIRASAMLNTTSPGRQFRANIAS